MCHKESDTTERLSKPESLLCRRMLQGRVLELVQPWRRPFREFLGPPSAAAFPLPAGFLPSPPCSP